MSTNVIVKKITYCMLKKVIKKAKYQKKSNEVLGQLVENRKHSSVAC